MSSLHKDEIYNIMLHLDAEALLQWCSTCKGMSVCQEQHFWLNKFTHDDLPIITLPNNANGWLHEYLRVSRAKKQAELDLASDTTIFLRYSDITRVKKLPLHLQYLVEIGTVFHEMLISRKDACFYNIMYVKFGVAVNQRYVNHMTVSIQELELLLLYLYYYQ